MQCRLCFPADIQPENMRIRVTAGTLCIYMRHWIVSTVVGEPVAAPGNGWHDQICSVHHALLTRFQRRKPAWGWWRPPRTQASVLTVLRFNPSILDSVFVLSHDPLGWTELIKAGEGRSNTRFILTIWSPPTLLIRDPDWPGENKHKEHRKTQTQMRSTSLFNVFLLHLDELHWQIYHSDIWLFLHL